MQRDFCPGGALAVPGGDAVVPLLNAWIEAAQDAGAAVFALPRLASRPIMSAFRSRADHGRRTASRKRPAAAFHRGLALPETAVVIDKGTHPEREAYSRVRGH